MTPDQHHAEALRLIALAEEHWLNPEGGYEPTTDPDELAIREAVRVEARAEALLYLGIAQVHATLSLRLPTTEETRTDDFRLYLAGQLRDPEVRAAYEAERDEDDDEVIQFGHPRWGL